MLKLVVPAAGLGTRVKALSGGEAKALMPLGPWPALQGALLEAEAAGVDELAVVISPRHPSVGEWAQAHAPEGLSVYLVEQPEPLGVMDAVERARSTLGWGRFGVLYPDLIHRAGQRGLGMINRAQRGAGTAFGLVQITETSRQRLGRTAQVEIEPLEDGTVVIRKLRAAPLTPGSWHTTLAEVRGPRHQALIEAGPIEDRRTLDILQTLADEGLLTGVDVGDVLDLGIPAGYLDATTRLQAGTFTWRHHL